MVTQKSYPPKPLAPEESRISEPNYALSIKGGLALQHPLPYLRKLYSAGTVVFFYFPFFFFQL